MNRSLFKIIKTRFKGAKGIWLDEFSSILWAYKITVRTPTGETPFRLAYQSEVVILIEIGLTSYRVDNNDEIRNGKAMHLQLDIVDEVRAVVEQRLARYQDLMTKHYNSRIKHRDFQVGDLILRRVTGAMRDLSQGKFRPNWEGPYRVTS